MSGDQIPRFIVSCPNCDNRTKLHISDSAVGAVKQCEECDYSWYVSNETITTPDQVGQ